MKEASILTVLYRQPRADIREYLHNLEQLISTTPLASTCIIVGDINNDALNQSINEYLILLATYCFTNSMTILSHYFKLSKRWTCIYQFFINLCKQTATFETIPSDLSDNLPSFALI